MLQHKIAHITENRAHSEPLPKGSAPYTASNFFKTKQPGDKPKAKCWNHRFSSESRRYHLSPLKEASRSSDPSATITLGTARPSPEFYPWDSFIMRCHDNGTSAGENSKCATATMCCQKGEEQYDLSLAMNYGYAGGSPQVLRFITEHVELVHDPPYADWDSCITCGSTSAVDIAFRMFCNPGDTVLAEEYTYPGTITAARSQGINIVSIKMNGHGLVPEHLDLILRNWDTRKSPRPSILYTIPTGQNPTGVTQSIERRKAIYQLAVQYDLYIIEDDPYYFLSLRAPVSHSSKSGSATDGLDEYLEQLPPSYLSLDVSGRVLRMDSTSKILAPGLRCGWITASAQVVEKFLAYSEIGVLAPSGPSQVMLYKLLDETWGHDGFLTWLSSLSLSYSRRRNTILEACSRFLPAEFCTWETPSVGMFIWIQIDTSRCPRITQRSLEEARQSNLDLEDDIYRKALENGVLVSKGSWFSSSYQQSHVIFLRVTFAAAPEEYLTQAVERLGSALRSVLSI